MAPCRVSSRLPRFAPSATTAHLGLDRVTSAASTASVTEAGTGWTVGSLWALSPWFMRGSG